MAFADAVETLAGRGVVQPDPSGDPLACEVRPSALANLWVLEHAEVLLRTRARYGITSVRAAPRRCGAVRRRPCPSRRARGEAVVLLSFFALGSLRWEPGRVVSEIRTAVEPGARVDTVVRLEALEQVGPAFASGGDDLVWRLASELGLDPWR